MSEPISGTAAGLLGWKVIGGIAGMGAIGAALATIVVMSMTRPQSSQEWRVALISTIVGSIGGGAGLIRYLEIQHWAYDPFGMIAMLALVFACGLPAWTFVRALFKYLDKKKNSDIMEIVREVRDAV